jgi:hypothetical protein
MPLPAWIILAIAIAIGIIIVAAHVGQAFSWLVLSLGLIGGAFGIAALYEICRDLWRRSRDGGNR